MKIKIVVRPEDAQKAEAAAEARRTRQHRARWGLAALFGLVALSAAAAFFFIGGGDPPTDVQDQPLASAPEGGQPSATGPGVGQPPPAPAVVPPASESASEQNLPGSDAGAEATGAGHEPGLPDRPPAEEAPPAALTAGDAPEEDEAVPGERAAGEAAAPGNAAPPPAAPKPPATGRGSASGAPVVANVPAKPEKGVVRSQLADRVVDREPAGALQSPVAIATGGRTVYYFNEFRNLAGRTVTHRWEYDGRVMAVVSFKIEGDRWRVYSSKRIRENQRGDWRVTAVDKAGAVLAQTEFRAE